MNSNIQYCRVNNTNNRIICIMGKNILDTKNSNNYEYVTNHLEIHVLGGIKLNKLDSLRVTLSINKTKHHNKLR
ncbi:hypothetical protein [Zunongwangia pacifica]|uniref:Uncharacterized protein n=1 Tax=Zunongwangia pacifica TaxID=2911062 RepID=A0A9X2CPZ8_9FLAO|nr:hypothetical protein [Zunongwangia pacifica]MCL6220784.1 hypothetical protein [Zunongwangia pacifica]